MVILGYTNEIFKIFLSKLNTKIYYTNSHEGFHDFMQVEAHTSLLHFERLFQIPKDFVHFFLIFKSFSTQKLSYNSPK